MAVAHVQTAVDNTQPWNGLGTPANAPVSFSAPTTVGNTIVVCVGIVQDRTISATPTDDGAGGTNVYVTDAGLNIVNTCEAWIYWAPVLRASQTVTIQLAAQT